ncbi:hypothetical protein [Extibacter muris]|uniref:hypothetical protein n=1 Tax=Extibacter muris TaxID=1796622 RepID=UPI00210C90C9|nr:hypothetical protein [Extibacter muris]
MEDSLGGLSHLALAGIQPDKVPHILQNIGNGSYYRKYQDSNGELQKESAFVEDKYQYK